MAVPKEKTYTADEFLETEGLPDSCQLINGFIVDMSPAPNVRHQAIATEISGQIYVYIKKHKGKCRLFGSSPNVKLDDNNVVIPDIIVTCDPSKLDGKRHNGAPDWVIEIVSPGSRSMDYATKANLYHISGVREYWIIDPSSRQVHVQIWEDGGYCKAYSFDEDIPVYIYKDAEEQLTVNLSDIL